MENYSAEIKQEPETNFSLILSQHLKSEVADSIPFEQLTLKQIVDSIRPEPEVDFTFTLLQYLKSDGDDSISLEQFMSKEIIANIKHEPEVHFTLAEESEPEIVLLKEVKVVLRKFDRRKKTKPKLFQSFNACDTTSLEQFMSNQQIIVKNIKHEPEVHFTLTLPEGSELEIEQTKEVKIVVRKFDKKWKIKSKMFESCFFCGKCEYKNRTLDYLKNHLEKCNSPQKCEKCFLKSKSENVKECGMCDLKFDCNNCKIEHQNQDHRNGSTWYCNKCDLRTIYKFCLIHHVSRVHGKRKFHCDLCGKTVRSKSSLLQHSKFHLKNPCPVCHQKIAEYRFKQHLQSHSKKKLKCDECEKVYVSKEFLNNHKRRDHEINEVQCDLCSKIFRNKLLLRYHITNHLKVSCPICGKWIIKSHLGKHKRLSHSSGKKFLACHLTYCKQKFANSREVKKHNEIHIGYSNFKCPKCDHQTKDFQSMKRHMKFMSHEI